MSKQSPTTARAIYTDDVGPVNQMPRTKCCGVCAFRKNDPQGIQADPEWPLLQDDWASGWSVFYCLHTTDAKGRHQVCAAYHAIYGRRAA